jgi:hypothetical protein
MPHIVCHDGPDDNWSYCPSYAAALAFIVLFGLTTCAHSIQAYIYRKPFALVLVSIRPSHRIMLRGAQKTNDHSDHGSVMGGSRLYLQDTISHPSSDRWPLHRPIVAHPPRALVDERLCLHAPWPHGMPTHNFPHLHQPTNISRFTASFPRTKTASSKSAPAASPGCSCGSTSPPSSCKPQVAP